MLTGGTFQHLAQHTTADQFTRLCDAKPGSLRVSASEVQRSGTATIIADIMIRAVICTTVCTVIVANVMIGAIIGTMTETMGATIIAATP